MINVNLIFWSRNMKCAQMHEKL